MKGGNYILLALAAFLLLPLAGQAAEEDIVTAFHGSFL